VSVKGFEWLEFSFTMIIDNQVRVLYYKGQ